MPFQTTPVPKTTLWWINFKSGQGDEAADSTDSTEPVAQVLQHLKNRFFELRQRHAGFVNPLYKGTHYTHPIRRNFPFTAAARHRLPTRPRNPQTIHPNRPACDDYRLAAPRAKPWQGAQFTGFGRCFKKYGVPVLPNPAGCQSVQEAVTTAQMAREVFETDWIKLELIG